MWKSKLTFIGASLLVLSTTNTYAQPVTTSSAAIETTISAYQGPASLFQETHIVKLNSGPQIINISNLPNTISPESIMLDLPKNVTSSSYSYAPSDVTPQGLLRKMIGKNIGWATVNPSTGKETIRQGKLISTSNGTIIKFPEGIALNPIGRPVISDWPKNAMLGNGIRIKANASEGDAAIGLGYLASHFSWGATYVITLQGEDTTAKLGGNISIINNSGHDFKNANLRLIAGHINMRAPRPMMRAANAEMAMASAPMADGISESSAQDTHIYTLEGKHHITNSTVETIPFISSDDLKIRKKYVLTGYVRNNPEPSGDEGQFVTPEIRFSIRNDKAAGLGEALPAGTVRVMAMQDGVPMLLGEDRITNTPVGEQINLRTGRAFDVTAKRKQTSFKQGNDRHNFEASYEITLSNNKSTGVVVEMVERLPGLWKITDENLRHVKRDTASAVWSVPVPANGTITLGYSMKTHR